MPEIDDALHIDWSRRADAVAGSTGAGTATLGGGWAIGDAVNGGLLMALGAAALAETFEAAGHPDVLTWSAFFLTAAQPGPVEVRSEVLRLGRSVATGSLSLLQQGPDGPVERVRLTATFGEAGQRLDPVHRAPAPPAMPAPDACLHATRDASAAAAPIALLDRLDVRIDPATAGFAVGRPSGLGVIRAWVRLADGREPDIGLLPLVVDALMPASFDLGVPGWAPTYELTGQVLGRPAPGWLRVELGTDTVVGGFYVEDASVWDSTDRLVARSRQLAGVRLPAN